MAGRQNGAASPAGEGASPTCVLPSPSAGPECRAAAHLRPPIASELLRRYRLRERVGGAIHSVLGRLMGPNEAPREAAGRLRRASGSGDASPAALSGSKRPAEPSSAFMATSSRKRAKGTGRRRLGRARGRGSASGPLGPPGLFRAAAGEARAAAPPGRSPLRFFLDCADMRPRRRSHVRRHEWEEGDASAGR